MGVFTKQIITHNKIKFLLSNIITLMPGELEQFCRSFITPSCLLQQDGPEKRALLWPLLVSAPLRARGSPCHPKVLSRLQPCGTAPWGTHGTKHGQIVPYAGEVIHWSSTTGQGSIPNCWTHYSVFCSVVQIERGTGMQRDELSILWDVQMWNILDIFSPVVQTLARISKLRDISSSYFSMESKKSKQLWSKRCL